MNDAGAGVRIYEVRIRGLLSDAVVGALGGTRVEQAGVETMILIEARDRAELHAVLHRIEDFALELISITPRT